MKLIIIYFKEINVAAFNSFWTYKYSIFLFDF